MNLSKKVAIPLVVILLAVAAGGYYLWHRHQAGRGAQEAKQGEQGRVQYTCPMHPFIIKDKPGACPICGMSLVPMKKAEGEQPKEKEMEMLEQVSLSPTQMVMANVATVKVERQPLTKEINAVGIVAY